MVDELVERGDIWRSATEQAFRTVHRHRYLPDTDLDEVYRCRPVITKVANGVPISSSSDPGVMGIMIEELDIRRGHAILEIGTGTGYNAAILAELACRNGKVITMDIDDDICQFARRNLSMSGYGRVKVVCEDGAYGYAAEAPYDRIIVTAGVYDLSPHWVEQLRPNGLIVLPLRIRGQQCLVTFVRRGQSLHSRSVKGGGFMSLRGTFAGPKGYAETASGWKVFADDVSGPDMDSLSKLLSESPKTHDELIERDDLPSWPFALFLASRDPRTVLLSKHDSSGRAMAHGLGLYDRYAASLCLIGFLADNEGRNRGIFSFGSPGMTLALGSHVDSWRRMGSPRIDDLTITAYPTDSGEEHPGDLVIRHRYGLSFSWNPDPSESPSP